MAKVGSVAHGLLAPAAQQYVKAEDFDRLVQERNAYAERLGRLQLGAAYCAVMTVGFVVLSVYLAWEAIQ